ncbi:MAG: Mo-dependent nitrogenase C-terminal domain-containing protein [Cyanobacteria bacterium P01_F01_bin.3]
MASATQHSPYTQAQIQVWLRGLLTIAWADGHFDDEEKNIIKSMVESEFAPNMDFEPLEPIAPQVLADELRLNSAAAQNFLRMAVMVAISDGIYSEAENAQIIAFANVLNLDSAILESLQSTLQKLSDASTDSASATVPEHSETATTSSTNPINAIGDKLSHAEPLKPVRNWLDQLSVEDPRLARFVCKLVPSQCPFERDVKIFGSKVIHIPPMCKINPLYEQLVGLRFRALSYLADDVGEDVTPYL